MLKIHPRAQLVATVDPSAAARDWSRTKLGVMHFPDLDSAFREIDADAVLVTTPPKLHSPVLIEALEHGKHVLVEKPLVASPGEIRAIRILFRQYVPDILNPDHPIYQLNHSILVDMANHHFDLIRLLTCREISKVIAFEYETPENVFCSPSSAFCLLTLDNGVSVTWDGDWCHDHPRTSWEGEWEFIGSDARMFWRGEQDSENRNRYHPVISIEGSDGSTEKTPFQESIGDRRVPVLDHFIESILHARQPEPSVWDNVRVLRAVFGCIESSVSGREIFLKD